MTIEAALTGTLGRDPELKTSQSGKSWTRISVAVSASPATREDGETTWVSVACFGEVAEKLCATAKKGSKVYIEGHSMRISEWTGRNGEKRIGLELAAWRAQVVGVGALGKNKSPRKP